MPNAPLLAPERDGAFKRGRAKVGATTYYTLPGAMLSSGATTSAFTTGTDYYVPFYVQTPILVDLIAFSISTSVGGNARIGIYRADTDLQPTGAPLVDSGDIAISGTGVKTYTPSPALFLARGRYLTVSNQDTGNTWRVYNSFLENAAVDPSGGASPIRQLWRVTRAYAAFPTPGTAWDTSNNNGSPGALCNVFLRISSP